MDDYTADERRRAWERAQAVLDSSAETLRQLEARQTVDMANGEGRLLRMPLVDVPEPRPLPEPASVRQRAAERNFEKEMHALADELGKHCAGLANRITKLEAFVGSDGALCEAIGMAIKQLLDERLAKERAVTEVALEALRAELAVERRLATFEARLGEAEKRAAPATPAPMRRVV